MPATFTSRAAQTELERRDPGFGGRPPLRNRPTGGGGDGDNGDDGLSRRGPRELLQRYRAGLSLLLVGDLVFFLSLVSAFFVRQSGGHFDAADNFIADWRPFPMPTALYFSTGFLLLSSVTIEFGRRQLFQELDVIEEWLGLGRPMSKRTWPWLAATAALGGAYLACMGLAWRELSEEGVRMSTSPDSAFFYVLTASHAAHVIAGVLLLGIAAIGLYRLRRVEQRQILVDCVAWFWHAMGAFWLLLFGMLAFTR
jgi:cytochrome c oxidase subunit 3